MFERHLPPVDLRYWLGITAASIFGTNLGDLYAHEAKLGMAAGLGLLGVLGTLVFVMEKLDRSTHEVYYWLLIIIIRTGATNIADYAAYRLKVPELLLNGGLILLIAVLAMRQGRARSLVRTPEHQLPATGAEYWTAMLSAGVLGTVLGDVCEHALGEGMAALCLSAVLVGVLLWRGRHIGAFYWLVVAIARTAGTALGDWVAESPRLRIGLPHATLLSGILFLGILLLWPNSNPSSTREVRNSNS